MSSSRSDDTDEADQDSTRATLDRYGDDSLPVLAPRIEPSMRRLQDAFFAGLWEGLWERLTAEQAAELAGKSAAAAYLLSLPISWGVTLAGAVQGSIEAFDETLDTLRDVIDNWEEFRDDMLEAVRFLLLEADAAVFHDLGRQTGREQATAIASLLDRPFLSLPELQVRYGRVGLAAMPGGIAVPTDFEVRNESFVWEFAKVIGPVALGIVISIVTGGVAGAMGAGARVARAALQRVPRLARLVRKWRARIRLRRLQLLRSRSAGGHRRPEVAQRGVIDQPRAENLAADALHLSRGRTIMLPENDGEWADYARREGRRAAETLRAELDGARARDGLSPSRNPDALVDRGDGTMEAWDIKWMGQGTANPDTLWGNVAGSAGLRVRDAVPDPGEGIQAVRIAISLDGSAVTPRQLMAAYRTRFVGQPLFVPPVQEVIIIKDGIIHPFWHR